MGEVYEATDTRLDRSVAVKVLPAQFTADPDRRSRFEREARAVGSLTHPYIATLHDVGEHDGTLYLVMELVEGQTLHEQLQRGRLPVSQALEYAIQIADALAFAHERGIVHRDLKPGNILLTRTGVKLLDFGLAKLQAPIPSIADASTAVTAQRGPLTADGTVLGTLQYMSPEQLEGRDADARADIFALGCILYEMLSGRRAFDADSAARLMVAVLTAEPPALTALVGAPPALDHLVRTCLAKRREDRWQTARDVARQLEEIRASLTTPGGPVVQARRGSLTTVRIAAAAGIVAVLALVAVYWSRPAPTGQAMRFTVAFGDDVRYSVGEDFVRSASISPDGERIVFTGVDAVTGTPRLYIRPIASEKATPLEGSEYGTEPFWSPNSRSVGFYTGAKVMITNVDGGRPRELAVATATGGASWNDSDEILISLQNPGPLMLVSAAGGTAAPVTRFDPSQEIDHDWPQFLNDGNQFLYMARGRTTADNRIYLASLRSPERTLLFEGVSAFAYAAPDRVIVLRGASLMAHTLDARRRQITGTPVALAQNALPPFSASRTGALTYRTVPSRPNPLLWIRRDGTVIGEAAPPGFYTDPQISPDGTQVALATRESPGGNWDVSVLDLASGHFRKLTTDPATERAPVWSPDGRSIAFVSFRPGAPGLYLKNANGVGSEEMVLPSQGVMWPYQWTRDHLFYFAGVTGANNIGMLATANLREQTPLIQTPFNDVDGAVSPDGRWFAYTSNESGRWELYLTTLPVSGTKLQITRDGGCDPLWSPDGRELYYTKPATAELMSMPVTRGDPPVFGAARRIHAGPLEYPSAHSIDIDPNGERLIVAPSHFALGDLTVIVNWQALHSN